MNRLTVELMNHNIIYEDDEFSQYDTSESLVDITSDFIITIWRSAVLPSEIHIYDRRTYEFIGSQNVIPEITFSGIRTWNSMV